MNKRKARCIDAALVEIVSLAMESPEDMSALERRLDLDLQMPDIVAVYIKCEGNGLDNDWSRLLAARTLDDLFNRFAPPPTSPDKLRPMRIISGGCEGFTTPHMLVVMARRLPTEHAVDSIYLAAARVRSTQLSPSEIGTSAQILASSTAIQLGMEALGVAAEAVAYVHAVTPLIDAAHASKPISRAATALGAATVFDQISVERACIALQETDMSVHGSRCAVTAGNTDGHIDLLIFAHVDYHTASQLRSGSSEPDSLQQMTCFTLPDHLDTRELNAYLSTTNGVAGSNGKNMVALLYKADPPLNGKLRGERLALDHDSDIHAFRHFRAAMSGVLGAATGSTRIFIGGGAEHQCIPGGGLLSVITEAKPMEANQ